MSNFANNNNMTALFTAIGTKLGKRPPNFIGTLEEWNALPASEKAKYKTLDTPEGDGRSVDNVPTEDSENLVTSGGIYDFVTNKISNPNLLDNPWFTVNQRAVTSVTAGGQYIADRWRVATSATGFSLTRTSEGYISIDNTNGTADVYLVQRGETSDKTALDDFVLTASVMLSDGTIISGTIDSTHSPNVYYEDDEIKIYTNFSSSVFEELSIQVKSGAKVIIKATKLEVGDISTLHLETRPEYSSELAKCQRYFQRIGENHENFLLGIGYATTATRVDLTIYLPAVIREVTPTISLTGSLKIGSTTSSTVVLIGLTRSILGLNITTSGQTVGSAARVSFGANSYIDVNAEI